MLYVYVTMYCSFKRKKNGHLLMKLAPLNGPRPHFINVPFAPSGSPLGFRVLNKKKNLRRLSTPILIDRRTGRLWGYSLLSPPSVAPDPRHA